MEVVSIMEAKKDILAKGAIVQRDKKTYAITPHIPGGLITDSNVLRKLADVFDKYGAQAMKVTSSQRISIVGVQEEDLDAAWEDLGMEKGYALGNCVRSVRICPATTFCKRAQQDAATLGMEIDRLYHGMELPSKFKIAVAGCPNSCSETTVRDLGVMGTNKGYTIFIGGSAGVITRVGDRLAVNVAPGDVLPLIEKIVAYYKENAKKFERFGKMIDRIGFEQVKAELLGES